MLSDMRIAESCKRQCKHADVCTTYLMRSNTHQHDEHAHSPLQSRPCPNVTIANCAHGTGRKQNLYGSQTMSSVVLGESRSSWRTGRQAVAYRRYIDVNFRAPRKIFATCESK